MSPTAWLTLIGTLITALAGLTGGVLIARRKAASDKEIAEVNAATNLSKATMDAQIAFSSTLAAQVQNLTERVNAQQKQTDALHSEIETLKTKLADKERRIEVLQHELNLTRQELNTKRHFWEEEIEGLHSENLHLKEELEKLRADYAKLKEEYEAFKADFEGTMNS